MVRNDKIVVKVISGNLVVNRHLTPVLPGSVQRHADTTKACTYVPKVFQAISLGRNDKMPLRF